MQEYHVFYGTAFYQKVIFAQTSEEICSNHKHAAAIYRMDRGTDGQVKPVLIYAYGEMIP